MKLCKHDSPKDGCPACHAWATDERYRNAVPQPSAPITEEHRTRLWATLCVEQKCTAGTKLKELLAWLGIEAKAGECVPCQDIAAQMDRDGLDWCRANAVKISDHLRTMAADRSWGEWGKAALKSALIGLVLNPFDPFPGLVTEAIRRAEDVPPNPTE